MWERIGSAPSDADRRLRPPRNPWLLALQALVLVALVGALAGPSLGAAAPPRTTVYVLDDSLWMQIGSRADDARRAIARGAAAVPEGRVAVVTAGATPAIAFRGASTDAAGALAHVRPGASSGDLAGGITLGAGLLQGARGRLVVLRAPGTRRRRRSANSRGSCRSAWSDVSLRTRACSRPRRGAASVQAGACEVVATLRNGAARASRSTPTPRSSMDSARPCVWPSPPARRRRSPSRLLLGARCACT